MRFYDVTSWSYVNLDDPISGMLGDAGAVNGKQEIYLERPN